MKRITTLVLAMALVLGSVSIAKADGIDVKVKGQWDFTFGWADNLNFRESYIKGKTAKANKSDSFLARHRIRTQVNFITSEYLQGVLMFEIGNLNWGQKESGAQLDTDGKNVETKRAYLDWVIPNTEIAIRMGLQGLKLPSTPMGSPLFDADVAGIVASAPITDWLSTALFWIRPFDYDGKDGTSDRSLSDETDAFGIMFPMNFTDYGVSFTPWFIYGRVGVASGAYEYLFAGGDYDSMYGDGGGNAGYAANKNDDHANAWWLGGHLELTTWDPLVFNLEAIYGRLSRANLDGFYTGKLNPVTNLPYETFGQDIGTRGWFIGATLDYKLDFMTPGIFGWYASGDDKDDFLDDGWLGRMPVLGNDGGSFYPTSFGTAGGVGGISTDGAIMGSGTGTWGLGIQLADITFIEDLSHTLRLAYYRGTNDSDLVKYFGKGFDAFRWDTDAIYLTDEDYVWEVNFDHQYKIYENLTAILELGWVRLHADKDTWKAAGSSGLKSNDNAWKAQLSFKYSF